jgi:hypothetical protein
LKEPGPGLLLLVRLEEARRLLSSTMKHLGLVDTGPTGFLIKTIIGNGPWPSPPLDERDVMTDDANSK